MEDSSRQDTLVASEDEQSFQERSRRERRSMQSFIYNIDKIPSKLTLRDLQSDENDFDLVNPRRNQRLAPHPNPNPMNAITELDTGVVCLDDEQNKSQYLKSLYKKIKQVETHALILGYVSLAVGIVWPILYHLFKN